MNIYLSRDSVCAGDDFNPPHSKKIRVVDDLAIEEIIKNIIKSDYLPKIQGGKATWSVTSNFPLAVVAQEWKKPKMFDSDIKISDLDYQNKVLRLHFNYHAQQKPEIVLEILSQLRMKAI